MKQALIILSLLTIVLLALGVCGQTTEAWELDTPNDLSQKQIQQHVADVLNAVDQHYVYPETAKIMRQRVRGDAAAGKFQSTQTIKELVDQLQSALRQASKDNHISLHLARDRVNRKTQVLPSTASDRAVSVEVIPDSAVQRNIGYLRFNKFSGDEQTKAGLKAAMQTLAQTDALIVDLRDNGGGDPNLAVFLASYFVDENTHLWSIFDRNGESFYDAYSLAKSPKYSGQLCILTSYKTYSAAEAFAYTLKHLGRACIIGEASGGGAHLVQMERVNDDIDIRVPVARAYNRVTQNNWEQVGVIPTLEVEPSMAKAAAVAYLSSGLLNTH